MSLDKFNFFIPAVLEKGSKPGQEMKIKGIASSEVEDSDEQTLVPSGFDVSTLLSKGFLNYNHKSSESAAAIIGEPTKAEIINNGKDLYIEGFLYPDSDEAKAVYKLAQTLEKNSESRRLGFSIEGKTLEVDPFNKKRVTKAKITGVAITAMPKNPNTLLSIIKGEYSKPFVSEDIEEDIDSEDNELDKAMTASVGEHIWHAESVHNGKKKFDKLQKDKKLTKSKSYDLILNKYSDLIKDDLSKAVQIYELAKQINHKKYNMEKNTDILNKALENAFKTIDSEMEKITKSEDIDLKKGGEGSRGGKVIGHTKSGKPIYEDAKHSNHYSFSKEDHKESHNLRKKLESEHDKKGSDFTHKPEYQKALKDGIDAHPEMMGKGFGEHWPTFVKNATDHLPESEKENGQKWLEHAEEAKKHRTAANRHDYMSRKSDKIQKSDEEDLEDKKDSDDDDEDLEKAYKAYAKSKLEKGCDSVELLDNMMLKGFDNLDLAKSCIDSCLKEMGETKENGGDIEVIKKSNEDLDLIKSELKANFDKNQDTLIKEFELRFQTIGKIIKSQADELGKLKELSEEQDLVKAENDDLKKSIEDLNFKFDELSSTPVPTKSLIKSRPIERFENNSFDNSNLETFNLKKSEDVRSLTERLSSEFDIEFAKGVRNEPLSSAVFELSVAKSLAPDTYKKVTPFLQKMNIRLINE